MVLSQLRLLLHTKGLGVTMKLSQLTGYEPSDIGEYAAEIGMLALLLGVLLGGLLCVVLWV